MNLSIMCTSVSLVFPGKSTGAPVKSNKHLFFPPDSGLDE